MGTKTGLGDKGEDSFSNHVNARHLDDAGIITHKFTDENWAGWELGAAIFCVQFSQVAKYHSSTLVPCPALIYSES